MHKRIWMVGAFADNFGDRALQRSNADLLREHFDCDFTYLNCQKTQFTPQLIQSINKNADLLFFVGGGLVFRRDIDCSVSGWQFNCKKELIKEIRVPIVFSGIGYNRFPYQEDFMPGTWEHLQETVNYAALFSVRNTGTLNALKERGIDTSKVQKTPDCGMFLRPETYNHRIFDYDFKVLINWASDRATQRFNCDWRDKFGLVLKCCKEKAGSKGAVYLVEHLMPNEFNADTKKEMKAIFKREMNNGFIISEELPDLYPMTDVNAPFYADIYRQMDLVLGSRGHSGIVSFGMNTPFIGLGGHKKIEYFMKDVGLIDNLVPLDKCASADFDELKYKMGRILNNIQEEKCNINRRFVMEKEKKDEWFRMIAGIIK